MDLAISVPKSLPEAMRQLEALQAELKMAEDHNREQAEIVTDLLLAIGTRQSCPKCGAPAFWVKLRGNGAAILYNVDGSQHWPRCRQTSPPPVLAVASGE